MTVQPLQLDYDRIKPLSLNYDIVNPLSLDYDVDESTKNKIEERSWMQKHPNLYALGMTPLGTAKELSKISFLRYLHKDEREKFEKLFIPPTERGLGGFFGTLREEMAPEQVKQLLWDGMEATIIGATGPEANAAKTALAKKFPQIYAFFTKRLWGAGEESALPVAQQIANYVKKHGKDPSKKLVDKWLKQKPSQPIQSAPERPIVPAPKNQATPKTAGIGKIGPSVKQGLPEKEVGELYTHKSQMIRPTVHQGELPKYAQSVNIERQSMTEAAKRIEMEMVGPKKTQSWDTTEKLGNKIYDDIVKRNQVLKKAKLSQALTAEETHVVRRVNVNAQEKLAKMIDDVDSGIITEDVFNSEFMKIKDDIFKATSEAAGEAGRALNYYKKYISSDRMAGALNKLEKGMTRQQRDAFLEAMKNADDPMAMQRLLSTIEDPTIKDYIIEFWYNSILSGPPTHFVNAISNTAWATYQFPHRLHAAFWDKIYSTLTGKARQTYFNEIIPMFAGYAKGTKKGVGRAIKLLKKGQSAEFETKWVQEIGHTASEAWARSPNKIVRSLAPVIEAPSRALRAMDVWAKSGAADAHIRVLARRASNQKKLIGAARKKFEKDFAQNLSKESQAEIRKIADHWTFMDSPDAFTNWILKLRQVPVIGDASRLIVPFVNTISNLTKRGIEFTPGLGVAKEFVSRKMGRGMTDPELIAKQIEGSILGMYIWYKYDQEEITASPENKTERDAMYRRGEMPWGIKVGDTWYNYRRWEPYNTAIASVAIARDKFNNAEDDDTRTQIFGEMARGLMNNLIDTSYFSGLQMLFNRYDRFDVGIQRIPPSFVPYSSFWRSINRAYEKVTEGEAKVREKHDWLTPFSQVVPGLSGEIPAQLTVWGEEKIIPGSVFQHWLPYKWSKEISDVTEMGLQILDRYPALPSQSYTYNKIKKKFDDNIYRNMCIDFGYRAKMKLDIHFESDAWQSALKDESKHSYLLSRIDKILNKERDKARRRAIREQRKKDFGE